MRTRSPPASLLACLLTASIITGGLLVAMAPVARAATVSVSIQGYAFHPSSIVVVIGVNNTVTWTNNEPPSGYGCPTHTVTANDGSFMSGNLDCGASFTYTFTTPGTFGYYCSIHPFMKGTVKVLQASTTTSSTSTSSSTSAATTTSTTSTTTSTSTTTATHTSSTPTTATTSSTTTSTSSAATTSPTTATTSSSGQTATSSSQRTSTTSQGTASASGGIPEFPLQGTLVAALAFALVASYFVVRRSRTPA